MNLEKEIEEHNRRQHDMKPETVLPVSLTGVSGGVAQGIVGTEVPNRRANDRQVDGGHYKKYGDLQPWDMWIPWKLNGFQCEVMKLVVRYRDKNGIKDLQKAIHYLEKLIEIEKANGMK